MKGLARWILFLFSHLCPRQRKRWAFGCFGDRFADNSKYLFLRVCRSHPDISAVWISGDEAVVRTVRSFGYRAYHRWSIGGIFHALRAKVYVVSCYVSDVNFALSGGAKVVNLWHGIPLKKIEFDITRGPLTNTFQPSGTVARFVARWRAPEAYRKPDMLVAPGRKMNAIYMSAFRIPEDRVLNAGFPRNEQLRAVKRSPEESEDSADTQEVAEAISMMRQAKRAFLFLPTFRDSGKASLAMPGFDWKKLDEFLFDRGWVLFVKLHPGEKLTAAPTAGLRSVRMLGTVNDVYPLLNFVDCLITDYSSVAFDFLLTRRPVLFVPWDLEEYLSGSREMYFDYSNLIPGPKPRTFKAFLAALAETRFDVETPEQAALRERMWAGVGGSPSSHIIHAVRRLVGLPRSSSADVEHGDAAVS
jgi:CDP-glycerol glycerophosphotransferase (TagB/SpsB family)